MWSSQSPLCAAAKRDCATRAWGALLTSDSGGIPKAHPLRSEAVSFWSSAVVSTIVICTARPDKLDNLPTNFFTIKSNLLHWQRLSFFVGFWLKFRLKTANNTSQHRMQPVSSTFPSREFTVNFWCEINCHSTYSTTDRHHVWNASGKYTTFCTGTLPKFDLLFKLSFFIQFWRLHHSCNLFFIDYLKIRALLWYFCCAWLLNETGLYSALLLVIIIIIRGGNQLYSLTHCESTMKSLAVVKYWISTLVYHEMLSRIKTAHAWSSLLFMVIACSALARIYECILLRILFLRVIFSHTTVLLFVNSYK